MLIVNRMARRNITVRMTEPDLSPARLGCLNCGATSILRVLKIQANPDIHWCFCRDCRCGFADRQPTSGFLNSYYAGYYDGDIDRVHIDPALLAARILKRCRLPGNRIRILDFGGGDGSVACAVATRLRSRGLDHAEISVVDHNGVPNPKTPKYCDVTILRELDTLEVGQAFDLVIASAVLEHIPNPGETLDTLWGLMAQPGWFYARTPYVLPLAFGLRRFGIAFDMNFPAHLFDLGAEFWANAGTRIGPRVGVSMHYAGPSPVESRWRELPLRTVVAHALKAPYWVLGKQYPFVGGWEVFMHRAG